MTSQVTDQRILEAEDFGNALSRLVNGRNLATNDRNRQKIRAAAAAFGIAQDHHHAIVFLLKYTFHSSSLALLRSVFEAYVRGLWLRRCATDAQVQKVMEEKEPPPNDIMITAIEALPDFGEGTLARIKKHGWKEMCDFAHTGGLHLQRWQSQDGIEPTFDPAELEACLNYAELLAAMSGLEVVQMSEGGSNGQAVLELIEKRWPPSPAVI